MIPDPPKATNNSVVREEAAVPNLTELLAIDNVINYNLKQSLVFTGEVQGVDIVFPSLRFTKKRHSFKKFLF